MIGVAISTTGQEHRMGFLETTVREWDRVLPEDAAMFVTVDGDWSEVERVQAAVEPWTGSVFQVGQVGMGVPDRMRYQDGRLGVAVNKNTGLELLMDNTGADHLFLCDDDTYPLNYDALASHVENPSPHTMVCWGKHRLVGIAPRHEYAEWNWPRGVLLHAHRSVVEQVGGMDERFGPGGHEHVEWSRRIYQHGLTPAPFVSPTVYATNERGPAMGAGRYWHCEDMPRKGEPLGNFRLRKRQTTSIVRTDGDWEKINAVMASRDGDTTFVPFRARDNGRASATLCDK